MVYPYISLPDGTEIVHTDIIEKDGVQTVEVHFERPSENCFDSARCVLPTYEWITKIGYSEAEIKEFEEFLRYNAHLIYRFAQNGGMTVA